MRFRGLGERCGNHMLWRARDVDPSPLWAYL